MVFVFYLLAVSAFAQSGSFVQVSNGSLTLDGQPFRFSGTNNYYLMYSPPSQVDAILQVAASSNFKVVRTWGWLDIGAADGSQSVAGKQNGFYFQYWNGSQPAYNDGANGLQNLDYTIYRAGQLGLRLIIPFTNNWTDFGGMDQYVRWRGMSNHDAFYTDLTIRDWYQKWIAHLLTRVNSFTGVAYKDDPTILGWELANEPRCKGSGIYPATSSCTTTTMLNWASDMAAYVKSLDSKHLLSAGDEGLYCKPGSGSDWTMNCGEGVDTVGLAALPGMDWMSFHLYPLGWQKSIGWGTAWVANHFADGAVLGKPVLMGEFGYEKGNLRLTAYKQWTDAMVVGQGSGGLFWWLTKSSGFDSFDVACPNAVCSLMSLVGQQMDAGQAQYFPPIADDDEYKTDFQTALTMSPQLNDVAFLTSKLDASTIDLDPATDGQQTSFDSGNGVFALQPSGQVLFTPANGFSGKTAVSYTIADDQGGVSNVAQIRVTVTPKLGDAITLYSFETGTEGWDAGFWQSNIGSVAVATDWSSDGKQSLQVNATGDGWFGVTLNPVQDWTGTTRLTYQVRTLDAGTSTAAVIKVGKAFLWCQSDFSFVQPNSDVRVDIDLKKLGCGVPDLSRVDELYVFFSGGGTVWLDTLRIQ